MVICKAWRGMVRYGVVSTKLKIRHLTLKQDLQCEEKYFTISLPHKITDYHAWCHVFCNTYYLLN